ncbi:MAG: hypothetical protein RTV72_14560 [Candidatus Thorarchaeota archaeon]
MYELQENRGRLYRHRKTIAGILIVFILLQTPRLVGFFFPSPPSQDPEITHTLTVWIPPDDEAFDLCIDFHISEQDAVEGINRERGISIVVEPSDDEETQMHLYDIQKEQTSFWLRIYFSDYSEDVFVILEIKLAQTKTTTLVGREMSILWELWHGE